MKTSIFVVVASLLASAMANPTPAELGLESSTLEARGTCKYAGVCSWGESGQCEWHCNRNGGFSHMQGCGWLRKRCCCNKS